MPSSDSSAVQKRNHKIYNGSGEVSWIFFLSHVNGHILVGSPKKDQRGWENQLNPHRNDVWSVSMMDCNMVFRTA